MDDALLMRGFQRPDDLPGDGERFDDWQRLCLPTTSYALTALNLRTGNGRLGSR
jgi:hypothetical protein